MASDIQCEHRLLYDGVIEESDKGQLIMEFWSEVPLAIGTVVPVTVRFPGGEEHTVPARIIRVRLEG